MKWEKALLKERKSIKLLGVPQILTLSAARRSKRRAELKRPVTVTFAGYLEGVTENVGEGKKKKKERGGCHD